MTRKATIFTCVLVAFLGCISNSEQLCQNKRPLKAGAGAAEIQDFMNCWGEDVENGQSDLVVLIDNSGSMGEYGFKAAKDFVTSLLTEVRVAFNATRIAVVTFSRHRKLELNYLWRPNMGNHKCKYVSL